MGRLLQADEQATVTQLTTWCLVLGLEKTASQLDVSVSSAVFGWFWCKHKSIDLPCFVCQVHPFMTTVYKSSYVCFQQDTQRTSIDTRAQSKVLHYKCVAPKSGEQTSCNMWCWSCQYGPKWKRNISSTLLNLCQLEFKQNVTNNVASECIFCSALLCSAMVLFKESKRSHENV